jgi:hypothetical protein
VSFHHRRSAKAERAAKNNECEIPTHRRSSRTPQKCTDRADMGVTAVTKQRFCLATMSALPPKADISGASRGPILLACTGVPPTNRPGKRSSPRIGWRSANRP